MPRSSKAPRAAWNSQFGFLMSAAGSAVGLGNIWKFPYIAGMNGGGFFVLFYLVCIFLVALPVMIAEIFIGQTSKSNAVHAFCQIEGRKSWWRLGGILGVLATVLIMSFYSAVGGWIFFFLHQSISNFAAFSSLDGVEKLFSQITDRFELGLAYQAVFILTSFSIVAGGVSSGIERLNKMLIPALVMIILLLLGYASQLPGFAKAWQFMFDFDLTHFSTTGMLEAVGHSFFTVSAGVGIMITYGSYLQSDAKIAPIAGVIVVVDTLIALASGMIIFSIVFSQNAAISSGPTLIFKTLPLLFSQIQMGQAVAILFFMLVTFTALTSSVSLVEVPVAYLVDKGISRNTSLGILLVVVSLLGTLCSLSFGSVSLFVWFGHTFFDWCDLLSSRVLLPVSGLLFVCFFGYKMDSHRPFEQIYRSIWVRRLMKFATCIVAPVAIIAIGMMGII